MNGQINVSAIDGLHTQGLQVLSEEFKELYFYNAINLLLEIDYVLNFGSYDNEMSKVVLESFPNMAQQTTKIVNGNNIWSVFIDHLNHHFNVENMFELKSENGKYYSSLLALLTENDWTALYKANYFDFRLYSLAKHIGQIDLEYYNNVYTAKGT